MFTAADILEEFVDTYKLIRYSQDKISLSFPWGHGYRTFANRFFGPRREYYLAKNRQYQKTWRERNPDKHRTLERERMRLKRLEKQRVQQRAGYWKIKDRKNAYNKAYVAAQKARDPVAWKAKTKEYRERYERKRHAKRT